ncbi:MAG: hypothetical protein KGI38_02440 [Thaumarchaeota archaeon]|nr:hypothetical protein [Nitrososphaerota archaeon]
MKTNPWDRTERACIGVPTARLVIRASVCIGVPFKSRADHELFNDCLYFKEEAERLVADNPKKNVFRIRRALRASFIWLWMMWEAWLNDEVQFSVAKRGLDQSVDMKDLLRLPFDTKLDLFTILSGIDLKSQAALMRRVKKAQTRRNSIVHASWESRALIHELTPAEIDSAIETTREFFAYVGKGRYSPATFNFLKQQKSIDLLSEGYGYLAKWAGELKDPSPY